MANIPFTIYEAIILLEAYLTVQTGEPSRKVAIKSTSEKLRILANNQDLIINDTYRNYSGIHFQMQSMESAYKGFTVSKPATKLFLNVVELYKFNNLEYQKKLQEVNEMIGNKQNNQNQFYFWLSNKVSQFALSEYYDLFSLFHCHITKNNSQQAELFDITDKIEIQLLVSNLPDGYISGMVNGKHIRKPATKIKECVNYYLQYLTEHDYDESAKENIPSINSQPSTTPSVAKVTEVEQYNDENPKIIDFDFIKELAFTKPVFASYFGEEIFNIKSWTDLYVKVVKLVYEDYPDRIPTGKSFGDGNRCDLGNATQKLDMVAPKQISEDLYIETNLSAKNIIDKLKLVLDICLIDYENINIQYVAKKKDSSSLENNDFSVVKEDKLLEFLQKRKLTYIDNRDKNGALWVLGGKELSSVLGFCKAIFKAQFNFTEKGSKATKGVSAWWTNKVTKTNVVHTEEKSALIDFSASQTSENVQPYLNRKDIFQKWLCDNQDVAEVTARAYASNISSAENYAKEQGFSNIHLYNVSKAQSLATISELNKSTAFIEYNKWQHNRFSAALKKFVQFLNSNTTEENNEQELVPYKQILSDRFPKGYRLESRIEMKKFKRYWVEIHNVENLLSDEEIRKYILSCGILYDEKVYEYDCLVDDNIKSNLLSYIGKTFDSGKTAIYYKALFAEFECDFSSKNMYNEEMLKAYLAHLCNGKYFINSKFISTQANITIDLVSEIKEVLLSVGTPTSFEELYKLLPHVPEDKIRFSLTSNDEFIWSEKSTYFHIDTFNIALEDLTLIEAIIQDEISEKEYIAGNELISYIQTKLPNVLEQNSLVSPLGIRNALAYKLKEKFSFKGKVISPIGKALSMEDVFSNFCKSKHSFTLSELKLLKVELETTIYFEAVYENSLRVSMENFVSREQAEFNVPEIDNVIEKFCLGDYMPICELNQFSVLPYCGFAWNSYLLEHYIDKYSKKFKLLHTNFNENSSVGAIVKKTSHISSFEELIIDVLAESTQELNSKATLNYLCEKGYMARRSYANIEQVLIKARELRNQKGY